MEGHSYKFSKMQESITAFRNAMKKQPSGT